MSQFRNFPLCDWTFGIDKVSMEIMRHMERFTIGGENVMQVRIFPYYNGRENCIGIQVVKSKPFFDSLVVLFGEHRHSDDIFVQSWVQDAGINPPCVADKYLKAKHDSYYTRVSIPAGSHSLAASDIFKIITAYINSKI